MAAVAVIAFIYLIVVTRRRRGGTTSVSPEFVLWIIKCGQLLLLGTPVFDGPVGTLLLVPALVLYLFPSFVLKQMVVPLGMPRVAYWAARCFGPVTLFKETSAGAALFGALALTRNPSARKAVGWLEQKANGASTVRGAGVVTAGLLAAVRGDRHRARCLFLLADAAPGNFGSPVVRAIARDWLVVDAARIGDWREVIRLGRQRGWKSLRWSYTMARIGERLIGDAQARADAVVWLCWLMAPRRRATLALLRQALAAPRQPDLIASPGSESPALPDALAGLADVLADRYLQDSAVLSRAIAAVDAALDGAPVRAQIAQRMLALGAPRDAESVISGFRDRMVELLVPCLEETPRLAGAVPRGQVLDRAVEQVRIRLFRDVEARCRDYGERLARQNALAPLAEWEAWALTRNAADRLLALSPGSEHALFGIMYAPACNFAVFQHNKTRRLPLAHEIYSWLRQHAGGDAAAMQLLLKNMRASRSY